MVKTSKTDRIFKEAAEVIRNDYSGSSYCKESCILMMHKIGQKRAFGYLIFMEAIRPYALQVFNYKRSIFNKYKLKDRKLLLKGESVGILDRPRVLKDEEEKNIIAAARELGVSHFTVDLFGLEEVFKFLWECVREDNPYRFTNLVCLDADSRLLELSVIIAHELKIMDDETYDAFMAYIKTVRSL